MLAHYLPPFDADRFFYIPKSWLEHVSSVSELDAGMALLVLVYDSYETNGERAWSDGRIFKSDPEGKPPRESSPLDFWSSADESSNLPPLSTRTTLSCRFNEFDSERKLFIDYRLRLHPNGEELETMRERTERRRQARLQRQNDSKSNAGEIEAAVHRTHSLNHDRRDEIRGDLLDAQRQFAFELAAWPPRQEDLIYCPRGYMLNRWPVWFGQRSPAARAALLGLIRLLNKALKDARGQVNWNISFTLKEIQDSACTLLAGLAAAHHSDNHLTPDHITNGMKQLEAFGALRTEGNRYSLLLDAFAERPHSTPRSIRRLHTDLLKLPRTHPLLFLLSWLVNNQLAVVAKSPFDEIVQRLFKLQQEKWFSLPEDFRLFCHFVAKAAAFRRRNPSDGQMPKLEKLITEYIKQYRASRDRRESTQFSFNFRPDTRAQDGAKNHEVVIADAPSSLRPQAIWLLIEFQRSGTLAIDEVYPLLNNAWFVIDQPIGPEKDTLRRRTVLPVGPCRPKELEVQEIYHLDAVGLNGRIDFSRPFQVLLFCEGSNKFLKLDCRLLLFYDRAITQ